MQHYQSIFTHTEALLGVVQADRYLGLFRIQCNSRHIHNLAIFRALAYLELEAYSKPFETLTRNIQNPGIVRTVYSGIFRHIQNLVWRLHMQKPGVCGSLEYSEPFYNSIPTHIQNFVIFTKIGKPCVILEIQNPGILTIIEYSDPWQI